MPSGPITLRLIVKQNRQTCQQREAKSSRGRQLDVRALGVATVPCVG